MTDKEVKTENLEHCIEAQSLCLGFTSSNVPHLSVAKTIAQEAPLFLLFYQKSDCTPNYVQALFLALAFNFFLKRPDVQRIYAGCIYIIYYKISSNSDTMGDTKQAHVIFLASMILS